MRRGADNERWGGARGSRPWWVRFLPVACLLVAACGGAGERATGPGGSVDGGGPIFTEVAADVGLDFVHFNGMSGEKYSHEALGGGGALFDYDNDGDLDLYLVQGAMQGEGKTVDDAAFPPRHTLPLTDRLYRNDLEIRANGSRELRFTDVTEESGIEAYGYGMGVAAGDYDNDGWVDLYVTNFGPNQMLRNNGDGTFSDMTEVTGTGDPRWSVPASFVDYDRDGWLDLYVGNYLLFTTATNKLCRFETGLITYCGPLSYRPEPDSLYRNRGDGTFEDVSRLLAGVQIGGALGVVAADFNLDGWLDLYVANDALPNHLLVNQGDGTLLEDALFSGVAVNMKGDSEGSMGVMAADIDNDGDEDLLMTHIDRETNTVYFNNGGGFFDDVSSRTGLSGPSWAVTGFGMSLFDYDNDGWLDLIVANGSVYDLEPLVLAGDPYALHQKNQLFHNLGAGQFQEVSEQGGEFFELSEVSRGVATGDVDNDGDLDVVVVNNNGPVRLLLNNVGRSNHWIGFELRGASVPRAMEGSWLNLSRPGGGNLARRAGRDGSYASSRDPRVLFGLGDDPAVEKVRVLWPDGSAEEWQVPDVDRYRTLRQGTGTAVDPQLPLPPALSGDGRRAVPVPAPGEQGMPEIPTLSKSSQARRPQTVD